jgi:hypothetical protein
MSDVNERLAMAVAIMLNPSKYKVCEGCGSIVSLKTTICPNCHAYRYNDDSNYVVKQAECLGNSEQTSVTKDDLFK